MLSQSPRSRWRYRSRKAQAIRWLAWLALVAAWPGNVAGAAVELRVPDGFEVELVAGSDLVARPICADFDERGFLYVAESSGSNDKVEVQLEDRPHRILRLQDEDGDGVFDRRTIFADQMMLPQGILCHGGAVYCGAPPSIWKLQDTDGDGVADRRSEWWKGETLTGCANDVHGPYLGPDGFLYWCKGAFARQKHTLTRGRTLDDSAAHIYRARPDGSEFDAFLSGGMDNPVEIAWDEDGNLFFTTTFFNHPRAGLRDAIVHGQYGAVYPKVHGVLDGLIRTGDLMPAMTHLGPAAPCGLLCYRGGSFGPDFSGDLFCCQFNTHKVSRHRLQPSGSTFTTLDSDFVTSDDPDFHPTDILQDKDGSLLIIDTGGWYKLCCPTSQMAKPEVPGAIYRVRRLDVTEPTEASAAAARSRPTGGDAIERLSHRSAKVRRMAAEEIAQAPDPDAVAPLLKAAAQSVDRPLEHAIIYALIAIADPLATAPGLVAASPQARRAALIALDQMGGAGAPAEALSAALESDDASLSAAAWWIYAARPERGAELLPYFERHPQEIGRIASLPDHPALIPIQQRWISAALASRDESRVAETLPVLRGLDPEARRLYQDDLATISRDETISNARRLEAIGLLADRVPADLFPFLGGQDDVRAAAQLARMEMNPERLRTIASALSTANALQLPRLLDCFRGASSRELGEMILAELEKSKCLTSLREDELGEILAGFPAGIRERALRLVLDKRSELADPTRLERIIAELPTGDRARGHRVFNSSKAACFSCHAIGYRGGDFGPGLSRIGAVRGERDLLEAIVFPSASLVRSYEPVQVSLQDGGSVLGIIADQSDDSLSLRLAPGAPSMVIPRKSIRGIAPAQTSLMPAGLDEQLSRQELADLIAFLKSMR
jgi:putative membrane-bound dehydrogenase-like protein